MAIRPKPYTLRGEPTLRTVEEIDEMFEMLFKDTAGAVPGRNRDIIFNNRGELEGANGLFWDPINKLLVWGVDRSTTYVGLRRDPASATLQIRLADDSADASLTADDGTFSGSVVVGAAERVGWSSRARITSPADSQILVTNDAGSDFGRLMFGGTTSSFPALKRDGTSIQVRLADDSEFADLRCRLGEYGLPSSSAATLIVNGGASGGALIQMRRTAGITQNVSFRISTGGLTIVDDTTANIVGSALGDGSVNQYYLGVRGSSVANARPSLISGTTHTSAAGSDVAGQDLRLSAGRGTGAGTPGDLDFQTGTAVASGTTAQTATSRWKIKGTTGNLDAQAGTEMIRWGTTASFPALKRSSTELQLRLADDSADAPFKASQITTSSADFLHETSVALADGAGAQTGTLTNAPAAGNPTKWIAINDNGTTRYIPTWEAAP